MANRRVKKKHRWSLIESNGTFSIRRWIYYTDGTKKYERYPSKKFKDLTNREDLENFVRIINHREFKREKAHEYFKLEGAFIPKDIKRRFHNYLDSRTTNPNYASEMVNLLENHFFSYWYKKQIPDYLQWEHKQENLYHYLKSKRLSKRTINKVAQTATRFFTWLHRETNKKTPLLNFSIKSIPAISWNKYESNRKRASNAHEGYFINEDDWRLILKHCPEDIKGTIQLCYWYGLRRSEALDLEPEDLRRDFILIDSQLEKYKSKDGKTSKPTKSGKPRKVKHYFKQSLKDVYEAINNITLMNPDTFSKKWKKLMNDLDMRYNVHDPRRTFCTRLFDKDIPAGEIQIAMGHSSITTTEKYRRDKFELDDEVWTPEAS